MTVGPEFLALLDELRAELSHSHPAASLETLLAESMKLALAARRKRSRAQADRPRRPEAAAPARSGSRLVPAEVRRRVWQRDRGRCTFVAEDGRRCDATHQLELHHDVPFARGGPATVANVQLMCRLHNDLLARRDYGDGHMDRFRRTAAVGHARASGEPRADGEEDVVEGAAVTEPDAPAAQDSPAALVPTR